jgi:hypothetical protein
MFLRFLPYRSPRLETVGGEKMNMARLQNTVPAQTQTLAQPPQLQLPQLSSLATESIPLTDWNSYGFAISKSRIQSWIAKARVNGIMREGAVLRFGQRYYVNPTQLHAWMNRHGDRTPLARRTTQKRRDQRAGETRPTDDKEQQAVTPPLQAQEQPTQARGQRHQMTDAQVRNLRKRYAAVSSTEAREAEIKRQAKRLHFTEKSVREAATGRTYRHLPMPKAQTQAQTQAVETAAPA